MKKTVKIVSFLLSIILVLPLAVACKGDGDVSVTTTAPPDDKVSDTIVIYENESYAVDFIFSETSHTNISSVCDTLSAKLNLAIAQRPDIKADSEAADSGERTEVLIGTTNRAESAIPADIDENDAWYYVGRINNKIVINGSDENMLERAMRCFISTFLKNSADAVTADLKEPMQAISRDYYSDSWLLKQIPCYKGDNIHISSKVYDCGGTILNFSVKNKTNMHIISSTTADEFDSYVSLVEEIGYKIIDVRTIESNKYVTLHDGIQMVYVYYTAHANIASVIVDTQSALVQDVSYTVDAMETNGAVFYQYGLHMGSTGNSGSGYPTNGMLLVARLADNSVIIFDGGSDLQMVGVNKDNSPMAKLNAFLHEITGKSLDEKVTIAAWVFTHPHSDHIGGASKFLEAYNSKYTLERIFMNFASSSLGHVEDHELKLINSIASVVNSKYPKCQVVKVHTGQTIQLADVTLQVLYTHEDNVTIGGASSLILLSPDKRCNNTSLIMRVSTSNMSMIVFGDADVAAQDVMLESFSGETLKSDIIQVSHHGYNKLYDATALIKATYAVFPQLQGRQETGSDTHKAVLADILKYTPKSNCYFAGDPTKTVGFAFSDGTVRVVYTGDMK